VSGALDLLTKVGVSSSRSYVYEVKGGSMISAQLAV